MFANVVKQWEEAFNSGNSHGFCKRNCLSEKVLLSVFKVKVQLTEKLEKLKLISKTKTENNIHSTNYALVKGVIASALYPSVKLIQIGSSTSRNDNKVNKFPYLAQPDDKRIYINQKSVNNGKTPFENDYMAYFLAKGNRKNANLHVHDSTVIPVVSALLFTPLGNRTEFGKIPEFKRRIKDYVDFSLYIGYQETGSLDSTIVAEVADFARQYY